MLLTDLITDLRLDLSDSGASLFEDPTLERCVRKAVFRIGKDLQIDFNIRNGRVRPTPEDAVRELMVILAQVHACQVMRSATANAFSFSKSLALRNVAIAFPGLKTSKKLDIAGINHNRYLLGYYNYKSDLSFESVFQLYLTLRPDKNDILFCHPGYGNEDKQKKDKLVSRLELTPT